MSNKRNLTLEEALKQERNEKKAKKGKKKGLVVAIIAGILVVTTAITGLTHLFINRKKNQNTNDKTKSNISTMDLSDMGNELIPEESKAVHEAIYGNTTGNIDKDKLVEKDGKIYVDQDSADKSDKVGDVSIDTKGDTLVVKPDGTVQEKNPGYEVKDETGKVVDSGEGEIPKGYAWDSVLKKYLPKEEVGKYVYADATYYDKEGNIAIQKGDVVSKETLAKVKKYFSTTKPQTQTQPSTNKEETKPTTQPETQPSTSDCILEESVKNEDGVYTDSYGNIWINYEAYVNGMLDFDNVYTMEDGILRYDANLNEKTAQKTR